MKVLQICNYYYPHIGAIEHVARDISSVLKEDHQVKVFCFDDGKKQNTDTVDGVEVIKLGSFMKISYQPISFKYRKMLTKTFEEFAPDLVIFHYPNPFGAGCLLRLLKKYPCCKLIIYWHSDIFKFRFFDSLLYSQNKALIKTAVKIIASSPNYLEGSKQLCSNIGKCAIVPYCVSPDRIVASDYSVMRSKDIKYSAHGKTICFAIGKHIPYKGFEYLVRASARLTDKYVFYIAGQGPLTERLKKLASKDKKVIFLGRISDEELRAYLLACDIFCFPSVTKEEAFGIALAEAMHFGKPSVTFTVPDSGVNFVSLSNVTGIEAPNKDYELYAEGIKTLANNKTLRERYGKSARIRANEMWTMKKFNENIKNIIGEISER